MEIILSAKASVTSTVSGCSCTAPAQPLVQRQCTIWCSVDRLDAFVARIPYHHRQKTDIAH
eukprot:355317-Chlamydomonas_euryale.AAC.3